jgi:hypothetical protein
MKIDSIDLFERLAVEMNAHPERYGALGEAYMDCIIAMRRLDGTTFAARLVFDELRCDHVLVCEPDEPCEFRLDGPLEAWQSMFDDIEAHARATGLWTINSLALMGDQIACLGNDPMGWDKFSRFNQTLQEYLDGAARIAAPV